MFVFYETSKAIENSNNPYLGLILIFCIIAMIVGLVISIISFHKK